MLEGCGLGVLIGHGEHDGTRKVTVPVGLQLDFFANEDSPLPMVLLFELLRRGDGAIPIETVTAGTVVPNYLYKPFNPDQIAGIKTVRRDMADMILVGDTEHPGEILLCSNPDKCEPRGRHDECTGVFGLAAHRGWTRLRILCCRTNTRHSVPETKVIKGVDGKLDTSFYDQFRRNVMNFAAMLPADQDATWAHWGADERTRQRAIDAVMAEWADCYLARQEIDKKKDLATKADVIRALPIPVVVQLLRDHPGYSEPAKTVFPAGRAMVESFLGKEYSAQEDEWIAVATANEADLLPLLTDARIASWARLYNILQFITYGLCGDPLVMMLTRLDPAQRRIVISRNPSVHDELARLAPQLLVI
jgi:hypothetical protein